MGFCAILETPTHHGRRISLRCTQLQSIALNCSYFHPIALAPAASEAWGCSIRRWRRPRLENSRNLAPDNQQRLLSR